MQTTPAVEQKRAAIIAGARVVVVVIHDLCPECRRLFYPEFVDELGRG